MTILMPHFKERFERFVINRRKTEPATSRLLSTRDGTLDRAEVDEYVHRVMRHIACDGELRLYHARYSFATWMDLDLSSCELPQLRERFTHLPLTHAFLSRSEKLTGQLFGSRNAAQGRTSYAIACLVGHIGPAITHMHYTSTTRALFAQQPPQGKPRGCPAWNRASCWSLAVLPLTGPDECTSKVRAHQRASADAAQLQDDLRFLIGRYDRRDRDFHAAKPADLQRLFRLMAELGLDPSASQIITRAADPKEEGAHLTSRLPRKELGVFADCAVKCIKVRSLKKASSYRQWVGLMPFAGSESCGHSLAVAMVVALVVVGARWAVEASPDSAESVGAVQEAIVSNVTP
ncbi:hypothetical protein [Amphibiibacter pelophylacis]|uniref:Uncharacterized protein n=1 Tax=Amphibiibacter pelophylacis TaxID=1799477 RepID=A0ACC6P4N0_9BURK